MSDIIHLDTCSVDDFYKVLLSLNGIEPIHARIHKLLCEMQKDISLHAQKFLYIYFSLLEEGNTRIALDYAKALNKWLIKWDNLIKLAHHDNMTLTIHLSDSKKEFEKIFKEGIHDITTQNYNNIIEKRVFDSQTDGNDLSCPFVRVTDKRGFTEYLYATRYFDAKCIIESKAREIFSFTSSMITVQERSDVQNYFIPFLKDDSKHFKLADCQVDAIIRGQTENLIITGGPGTGKTTVICFLLWKLFSNSEDMFNWNIKMAAPSGKAADRMRESLLECLSHFKDTNSKTYQKLHNIESFTLHRLLSYNPQKNQFNYNADNRFPENSIFIIDEASMIDIVLFAHFMQALPKDHYKVLILGDPDQLPSVEAGAVLGEMLKAESISIKLDESKRFDSQSNIGMLAHAIQEAQNTDGWPESYHKPVFKQFTDIDYSQTKDNYDQIHYITLDKDRKLAEIQLTKLIQNWVDAFYHQTHYIEQCQQIKVNSSGNIINSQTLEICNRQQLNSLWEMTKRARILSSERKGLTGVTLLNEIVRNSLRIEDSGQFYMGQLLMLTENQSSLELYNGDCGIVVGGLDSARLYLLLKKVKTQNRINDSFSEDATDYVTYPLSLLPSHALESAFAMTIHKSQGSGYGNIMMFLPQTVGHPLLNNQMIYTGVTRTERISLTIVANQEAFEFGCRTKIVRDTGIDISPK